MAVIIQAGANVRTVHNHKHAGQKRSHRGEQCRNKRRHVDNLRVQAISYAASSHQQPLPLGTWALSNNSYQHSANDFVNASHTNCQASATNGPKPGMPSDIVVNLPRPVVTETVNNIDPKDGLTTLEGSASGPMVGIPTDDVEMVDWNSEVMSFVEEQAQTRERGEYLFT